MKKLSLIALVAMMGSVGFAVAPAMATVPEGQACKTVNDLQLTKDIGFYATWLSEKGYHVSNVTPSDGCLSATMTDSSGHQSLVLFDPATLQQVGDGPSAKTAS